MEISTYGARGIQTQTVIVPEENVRSNFSQTSSHYGSFFIRDGSKIIFWKDKWLGNATLREQYSALYNIVRHKSVTLAKVLKSSPPNVSFRRSLIETRQALWNDLLRRLDITENGNFSVASMYNVLIQPDVPVDHNKEIWKLKIPLKTKVFAWYLLRGVILTKDNLAKHN
jgi:hypothetical protein